MQIVGIVVVALIVLVLAACSFAPFVLSSRIAERETVPLEAVIAATSIIAHDGDCMERPLVGACGGCPFCEDDCDLKPAANLARARKWLSDRKLGSIA